MSVAVRPIKHSILFNICTNYCLKSSNQFVVKSKQQILSKTNRHFSQNYFVFSSHLSVRNYSSSDDTTAADPKSTETVAKTDDKSKDAKNGPKPLEDIRVVPKLSKERAKVETSSTTTSRNFITPIRAMNEYLLKPNDLNDLRKFQRRSPYANEPPITVYLRKDIETKALQVWGSYDSLHKAVAKRKEEEQKYSDSILNVKKLLKDYKRLHDPEAKLRDDILRGSGRVVMTAVCINGANFFFKALAWLYTGSHSLFAEAIHSLADTCNQLILAFGIRKSLQRPNEDHPYGYHPMRYIASLISGVGIFCAGGGLSIYNGIEGLLHPEHIESLYWAFFILGGSLISEGGTLMMALSAVRKGAHNAGVTVKEYVLRGSDPSINVVLLEDAAAVMGVAIAAASMGLTTYFNAPIYDAIGSLVIGSLLGCVASFIIYTNSGALVGRSIPSKRINEINKQLEADHMVRAIHDVKATDMGNEMVRYKAEVDFDGRTLTRRYLDSIDMEVLMKEMQEFKELEEVEAFMLKHGENIVDLLGAEVDRIEKELKKRHPQVRHVDLEVL